MRRSNPFAVAVLVLACVQGAFAGDASPSQASPPPAVRSPSSGAPPSVAARDADPALWVLRDADTTIYLFGTIHVLQPGLSWFDEAVATAFESAEELRTEVVMPDDPATLVPVMLSFAVAANGPTLREQLTPAQREIYVAGLQRRGLAPEPLDRFEPWFVGLQVSLSTLLALGMNPEHGVEEVLRAAAKSRGMRTSAFETVEEQMEFIRSTPRAEQIASMLETLGDDARATQELRDLVDSWAEGQPERTGELINDSMRDMPVTARLLLTDRNRRWARSLKERMAEPGTVFVAVGAGHLAGRDSVQDFLAGYGLHAERVSY